LQVVFSAILGASLGSFFNVAAHRSVTGRPWWGRERSVCESCGKELSAWELVPLVSWVLQRGRCRSCGARISLRYLVVEVVGAAAAGLMAWRWGLSWAYVLSMTAVCGFLINSLTDYESGDVFDAFALMTGLAGLAIRLAGGWGALLDGLVGVVAGWGLFAAIILSSRLIMGQDGMGWGDACFMGGMGAVYGWKMTLLAFYMGIMCGGVGSLWLLFRGKVRWGRHDAFALVPYLSAGGFLTLLFGPWLLGVIGLRFQYFPLVFQTGWPW
jgi:leader peptidase (prepilin peptidase)/N-methyltransferase